MKHIKENWIDWLVMVGIGVFTVLLFCFPIFAQHLNQQERDGLSEDCATLRSCIAEVYINIMHDPDYVYTGTDDQPMQVPEKYYTVKESTLGDGRVYAVVDRNNNVEAYFGVPERNLDYYRGRSYERRTDWLVRSIPFMEILFAAAVIGLLLYSNHRKITQEARIVEKIKRNSLQKENMSEDSV